MRLRALALLLALMLSLPGKLGAPQPAQPVGGRAPAGYIALTFDDGPSGAVTEDFLQALEQRGAACTFFICNYRLETFPTDLTAYAAHGHELAIHSWNHKYLRQESEAVLEHELGDAYRAVAAGSGLWPVWFRPPGGIYDEVLQARAAELGLSLVLWSVDPVDWDSPGEDQIVSRVLDSAQDGDVVLMHDIYAASRRAALRIVDGLQARGYELVTLSDLARAKGVTPEPGAMYFSFRD